MLVFFKGKPADTEKPEIRLPSTDKSTLYQFNDIWAEVPVFAEHEGQILKIKHDEDNVTFRFEGDNFKYYQFYIDEDQNSSTGYTGHGGGDLGAEFRIENGVLHKHIGPDWAWESLGNISAVKQGGMVEVKIDRDYFTGNGMLVFFKSIDTDWATITAVPTMGESYLYQFDDTSVSIQTNQNIDELEIYPNPAAGFVNVVLNENVNSQQLIRVFSASGQMVLSRTFDSNYMNGAIKLDLTGLAAGVYSIVVKTDDTFKTGKIVKQ